MTIVYLHGSTGRMGLALSSMIQEDPAFSIGETVADCNVVLDFSAPSALGPLLNKCIQNKKPVVIGTTGYKEAEKALMQEASKQIPLFYTPNFSFGIALLREVVSMVAEKISPQVAIEIIEAHHQHKKDSPSGSALSLAEATGRSHLPIHSIRLGDIVGDHTVIFGLEGERLELKHQAHSRMAFARGALRAAQFLKSQPPGYYTMKDLLYASC